MGLVLVIDDDRVSQKFIESKLSLLNHDAILASSGTDGLDLARNGNPDLIILDIEMPDKSGFEVLDILRSRDITRDIPVIILSSHTKKDYVLRGIKLGISGYLSKQLDFEKFKTTIEKAIGNKTREVLNEDQPIIITRQTSKTILKFRWKLDSSNVIDEAKKILKKSFLDIIKGDAIILDLRYIPEFQDSNISVINELLEILTGMETYIVAGRHFGKISLSGNFADNQLFITYEDLEKYLFSG